MAGHNFNNSQNNTTNGAVTPANQSEEENVAEEYDILDSRLDELNSALDFLEQQNDNIHDQLKELLQSNIEIRQEMQQNKCNNQNEQDTSTNK